MTYHDVLHFWFEEISPSLWWKKDEAFDHVVRRRFGVLLESAARAECFAWRSDPRGRLAEVLVLDQFSRHIHRDTPLAFAQDPMALALAQEAVAAGADQELPPAQRVFLYLPYEHSESLLIHETAERLFRELGDPDALDFELRHKVILERFGRYPHRNEILGRESTPEELVFLQKPESGF